MKPRPRLQTGDALSDLAPELIYRPEQDGCRWAAKCADCPRRECTYDAPRDNRRRREEKSKGKGS